MINCRGLENSENHQRFSTHNRAYAVALLGASKPLRYSPKSHAKIFHLWSCGLPQLRGKIFAFGTSHKPDVIINSFLLLSLKFRSSCWQQYWRQTVTSCPTDHPVGGNPRSVCAIVAFSLKLWKIASFEAQTKEKNSSLTNVRSPRPHSAIARRALGKITANNRLGHTCPRPKCSAVGCLSLALLLFALLCPIISKG
jgi:hypothetical protein